MVKVADVGARRADSRAANTAKKRQKQEKKRQEQERRETQEEERREGTRVGEGAGAHAKSVGVDVADQLYAAGQAIDSVYDDYAKSAGLTPTEFYVYWALEDLGTTATQKRVSEYMRIPKQTVAAVIAKARAAGLVDSTQNPHDARSSYITLTPRGHAMFDALNEARKAAEMRAYETVGDENIRQMIWALKLYRFGLQEGFGLGERPASDES